MKQFLSVTFLILLSLIFTTQTFAQIKYEPLDSRELTEYGVTKGTMIPHDLSGTDQNDRKVNLEKLSGENGIVLYFMRSADWSQFCIFQLAEISQRGSIIEDTRYNIVIITNDSVSKLARFTRKYNFPYPMISDEKSEIIKAFGLLNTNYQPGTSYYGVAHPAIYVIGKDGLILDKIFDHDFKKRATVSEVRNLLDNIGDYTPEPIKAQPTPKSTPNSADTPKIEPAGKPSLPLPDISTSPPEQ